MALTTKQRNAPPRWPVSFFADAINRILHNNKTSTYELQSVFALALAGHGARSTVGMPFSLVLTAEVPPKPRAVTIQTFEEQGLLGVVELTLGRR